MAYCPSGSCVKRVGKMTEAELWKLIHDVAAGLAYLHEKDVIHQDIKPDNILVDTEGNYLITDFGISTRARSTLRKSVIGGNTSGGTTAYMGPERFSRQPAPTKASDIWSFGAMAFELLEGVTPFGEIGGGMQKGGAEIPFINAPVSDALKYTIFKMLSKETWDRPTAATLVEWANNPDAIEIDYSLLSEEGNSAQEQPITAPVVETPTPQPEGRVTQRFNSGESITYGFLGYPVSQAADITCFDGELVPVGEDQLPLIEQCREIVRKFNSIYGEVLVEPKIMLSEGKRIKGLDGNEKMGKSLGNAIYPSDSEEEITRKVMGALTDPNRIKKDDLGNPDICMVAYYQYLVPIALGRERSVVLVTGSRKKKD